MWVLNTIKAVALSPNNRIRLTGEEVMKLVRSSEDELLVHKRLLHLHLSSWPGWKEHGSPAGTEGRSLGW